MAEPHFRLPRHPHPLIGREQDVEKAHDLLRDPAVRLLTITGPPGVGKTRLALEVAAHVAPHFEDGAAFVDLAPLREPAAVPLAIADALGLADRAGGSLSTQLQDQLQDMHLLLLLDNFEHLMEAGPQVAALLEHCPDVKVLTTSRESLRLSWEQEYALSPLEAPDPAWLARPEAALRYPAVALFAERARAVESGFTIDAGNGKAVAAICRRLDGLPLAIELAAARIKLFSPEALLSRLEGGLVEGGLGVLAGGARDVAERHRTLRNAIAWSYGLLTFDEQAVFRHLAVFSGGCILEAVRAVVPRVQSDLLPIVASLVDKSLVVSVSPPRSEPRFRLLEVIREFAREQLTAGGEQADAQRRHAAFFLALAVQAAPELTKTRQGVWLAHLEREADNFRAALDWAQQDDPQTALRMAGKLGRFWYMRGYFSEGRERLREVLRPGGADLEPAARAEALYSAGQLARAQGDYAEALACFDQDLAIRQNLGDRAGTANALSVISFTLYNQGDLGRARASAEEGVRVARTSGDRYVLATALNSLGNVFRRRGELEAARAAFQEAVGIHRQTGNLPDAAGVLGNLGSVAREQGDAATARRYHEQHVALRREIGDRRSLPIALNNLGNALHDLGDVTAAQAAFEESLMIARETGNRRSATFALNGLGKLAQSRGAVAEAARLYSEVLRDRRSLGEKAETAQTLEDVAHLATLRHELTPAATLAGAASALRQSAGVGTAQTERALPDALDAARRGLGDPAFRSAWQAGEAMSLDQAVEYALIWAAQAAGKPAEREKLSRREREAAILITRGLTNRQMAGEMFISERTAETHVQNILNKLGFSTRSQIAAWAAREGLESPKH